MDLGPLLVAELLALGVVTGFLAGLLGVGGGMMMVPFLTLILSHRGVDGGMAVKMAIATSMATILFTSLSSVRAHHRLGAVRWDLLRGLAPGIVLGGLRRRRGHLRAAQGPGAGAVLRRLHRLLGAADAARQASPSRAGRCPAWLGRRPWAAPSASLSGLVGAGGAFMSVPFMTWCNVPIRHAVGTSAALGFPIALANTAGYVVAGWSLPPALPGAFGYLYLPALAVIAAASVTMAPLGARTAQRMDTKKLKRVFARAAAGAGRHMLHRAFA